MSLECLEELAHCTIVWDWIWHWFRGLEPEDSLIIAVHHASSIRAISIRVLYIVMPRRIRLPDINLHTLNWVALPIFDRTNHQARLSLRIMAETLPVGHVLGFVGVERPQKSTFGHAWRFGVADCVDKE